MSATKEYFLNNLPFTDGFETNFLPRSVIRSRKRRINREEYKKLGLKSLTYK